MFTKITEERAFDGILAQIIENIRRGELKPGDTLPAERVMAESLGVSRPAVREVLRALELMGIVTTVRGGAQLYYREYGSVAFCTTGPSFSAE